MVQIKTIFVILTIIVAMTSGCLKSNELSNEPKVINLYPEQVILNDGEIKEILGNEWERYSNLGYGNGENYQYVETVYDKKPYSMKPKQLSRYESFMGPFAIFLLVFNNTNAAEEFYSDHERSDMMDYKGNKINVGDIGSAYSIKTDEPTGKIITKITFRKNNIISIMYLDSERSESLNMDTAINLAKKQEEKISKALEMMK
ncbi:MAG: hypothetical protein WC568_00795 [Candidatus Methanoperedens sp.]